MKKLFTSIVLTLLAVVGYLYLSLMVPSIGMQTRELFKYLSFQKDRIEDAKNIIEAASEAPKPQKNENVTEIVKEDNKIVETLGRDEASAVTVMFIDVGQGDAILVESAGQYMLIDTGNWDATEKLFSVFEEYKITELSALVLTHNDADHIGNADDLIYRYPVKRLYMTYEQKDTNSYKNLVSAIQGKTGGAGLKVDFPSIGDKIPLGNVVFNVLGPVKGKDYEDSNSYSIILKLVNGNDSFLFTGDATGEEVEDAAALGADFSAEVLKLAHHGSANCGCNSERFLNTVDATTYIVSCGLKNEFGHPHVETMNYARTYGKHLFRTDLQGTIVGKSYGNGVVWNKPYTDNYTNGNNL